MAMENPFEGKEVWFGVGSQDLYGEEALRQVAEQSGEIVDALNATGKIPVKVVLKPTLKSSDGVKAFMVEASANPNVIGVITWCHTFSPAKMWIRNVAVTEGDKTEAERVFGASINTWAVNELVAAYEAVKDDQVKSIIEDYKAKYDVDPALLDAKYDSLFIAAKEEAAMVNMMRANGCTAGVDNFEDLGALPQLPGVGPQRFPSEYGFGFSAEGDWKTAVLVRIGAVMGYGLEGGASLMEDYSYNFTPGNEMIMGSHMLEVSPSVGTIAKPKLEIHPLGIGGKADPVRLVFTVAPKKDAVVVSMSDVRERFRLTMNLVDVVEPLGELKQLPCARGLWKPQPDLKTSAECWLRSGASHHTCMTTSVGREAWEDFARIAGVELATIDANTKAAEFERDLEISEMYHRLNNRH